MSVADVLYDKRFIEILQENASLKLQLFWKDYHLGNLKAAMKEANATYSHCKCLSCAVTGRLYEDDISNETMACTFKPWFEGQLESLGMVVQWSKMKNENRMHICLNGSDQYCPFASVWDDDCHFSHFSGRGDWFWFTYGSKLWNAQSVNDTELLKLKSLFEILLHDPEEDTEETIN